MSIRKASRFIGVVFGALVALFAVEARASGEVALRLAVSTVECGGGDCATATATIQHTHFSVLVENLAYAKQVVVHVRNPDGTWSDLPGVYQQPADAGREVWTIDYDFSSIDGQSPRDLVFTVKYTVNGETYVDDDGGPGYALGQNDWAMLTSDAVLLNVGSYEADGGGVSFDIYVRNLAYAKDVTVVYSVDGWATVQTLAAHYAGTPQMFGGEPIASPNAWGVERWAAEAGGVYVPANGEIQFAIAYAVNGVTYWDNDFARNYVMTGDAQAKN